MSVKETSQQAEQTVVLTMIEGQRDRGSYTVQIVKPIATSFWALQINLT